MRKAITNKILAGTTVLATFYLFSCGEPVCKMPLTVEPLSKQASFVESTTTGESMIRATGKGCTFEQATKDAKKAAIWYVLYAGDRPILKTPEEKRKAESVVKEILQNPDQYIRWQSDVKSKRKEGNFILLTYLFKVDVNGLTEKLQEAGVIESTEDIAEEIGLPTIAVLSRDDSSEALVAITTLQEYLQDRDFEVYVKEQGTKINNIVKKIATLEGKADPMYAMALQFGSDIYVDVSVKVNQRYKYGHPFYKAIVNVKAYETATGKLVGASTGYSVEREVSSPEVVVQEAANDVADKITSQIKKEWVKEAKKGKPFKLVVFTTEGIAPKVDEAIYMALRKLSKRPVKRLASGNSMMSYIAYIKDVPNAFELYMKLKDYYNGPGKVEKVLDAGSFLVIKVGDGSSEIVIE